MLTSFAPPSLEVTVKIAIRSQIVTRWVIDVSCRIRILAFRQSLGICSCKVGSKKGQSKNDESSRLHCWHMIWFCLRNEIGFRTRMPWCSHFYNLFCQMTWNFWAFLAFIGFCLKLLRIFHLINCLWNFHSKIHGNSNNIFLETLLNLCVYNCLPLVKMVFPQVSPNLTSVRQVLHRAVRCEITADLPSNQLFVELP